MAPSNDPHDSKLDTVTDAASPMSYQAADRVLSTPELLCNIAAHLPLKDVLTAGAVCRDWHSTLAADLKTQQALFLKPREIREVIVPNRYIFDLEHPMPIEECTIIGEVNPFARDICGRTQQIPSLYPSVNMDFLHRGGLWREMFVTQPPNKTIIIKMYDVLYGDIYRRLDLSREAGIKMGELFDSIEEGMRYHPECRGSFSYMENFKIEAKAHDLPSATTRCMVRNGEVCRPTQLPEQRAYTGSENSQDFESESNDGHDGQKGSQGVVSYEDYESESGEGYSDDDEDPDEFAAEEADEADQYFRW
jgi:hypothetical protein